MRVEPQQPQRYADWRRRGAVGDVAAAEHAGLIRFDDDSALLELRVAGDLLEVEECSGRASGGSPVRPCEMAKVTDPAKEPVA